MTGVQIITDLPSYIFAEAFCLRQGAPKCKQWLKIFVDSQE